MKRMGVYELRGELARGAFGVVFRAHDPALDRPIALKVIRSEDVRDPESQRRFLREARTLAKLRHPHVIGVHSAGLSEGGYPYLAMDLIEGGSLKDRLDRERALPIDEAVRLGIQLADALAYAHSQGILHRDIKPHNVLLDGADAVLTDFGLAKILDADSGGLTRSGERVGTPAYMAPEQVRGANEEIGKATDVYGLGATLYQMVSGSLPFPGDSVIEVFDKIEKDPVSSVRLIRPDVDPELDGILDTCLAKEPRDRFASAGALRDRLRAWQTARDPEASGRIQVTPAPSKPRRWPSVVAALAALVVGWLTAAPLERATRRDVLRRELPEELEARYARGIERYLRDDFDGALQDIDHVIAEAPDCASAWFRRGRIKRDLKKKVEALPDIEKAIEIDPEFAEAYSLRAMVRPDAEDAEKTADHTRAIELDPRNAAYHHNRGMHHYKQKRDAEAKRDAERALELDPRMAQAYLLRGLLKKRAGDTKGALADYGLALSCEPGETTVLNARGVLRSSLGDEVGAVADFRAAIAAALETHLPYLNRSVAFEKQSDLLRALADVDAAIDIAPEAGEAYSRRAIIRMKLRRWAGAVADMRKAAELLGPEADRKRNLTKTASRVDEALQARRYIVEAPTVEMRFGPGDNYQVLADVRKGGHVTLLEETTSKVWAKIRVKTPQGQRFEGYVPKTSLSILIRRD